MWILSAWNNEHCMRNKKPSSAIFKARALLMGGLFLLSSLFQAGAAAATPAGNPDGPQTQPLLTRSSLTYIGAFRLPGGNLGSTYGFPYAGSGGIGTYAVAYNPARNSLFLGGHPYEQRIAEIAIPVSLVGTPRAAALSNLIDPLEGRLNSINPSDPNQKVVGSALVFNSKLYLGAFSFYDGAATQNRSAFARPLDLSTGGQVTGPVKIGGTYPGWVNKYAALIPMEWQALLGGPAIAGGSGGTINSLQSWGPSASVFDPGQIGAIDPVPAALVLGYPIANPLADTTFGNPYWSQADVVTGVVFPAGTRTVLYFGKHGLGDYCYGSGGSSGGSCYDPDSSSQGTHAYPYRSQVWAYDANELVAVKNGTKNAYDVRPYDVWDLDASFKDIQGVGYDSANQRLYVSQPFGDGEQPLIRVYQLTIAPQISVSGRVTTPGGQGLRNAVVSITDGQGTRLTTVTSSFGFYSFEAIVGGQTYILSISSKRYRFASRQISATVPLSDIDFVGLE
jgi:hypothetical protein